MPRVAWVLAVALGRRPRCGRSSAGTCSASTSTKSSTPAPRSTLGTIAVSSPAFQPGGAMPRRYTCDGAGVSPPLRWLGVPAGSVELLLLAIDLDGRHTGAVQWAVAGLPPSSPGIGRPAARGGGRWAQQCRRGPLGWDLRCERPATPRRVPALRAQPPARVESGLRRRHRAGRPRKTRRLRGA